MNFFRWERKSMKASGHGRSKLRIILRTVLCATMAVYALPCAPNAAGQAENDKSLAVEYSEAQGFAQNQVSEVVITDNGIMKISIDECSFCGAFKNEDARNRIARSALEWFLVKTGRQVGTVEWYNKSKVRIMTITGDRAHSEITSGLPCAIQRK